MAKHDGKGKWTKMPMKPMMPGMPMTGMPGTKKK
jgi:hypothetical protein